MKIEVNLERNYLIPLIIFGLIIVGFVGVYAYNSQGVGGNPAVFGHSVDEINWSQTVSKNITATEFCLNNSGKKDCRTSWPSEGGGDYWGSSGNNINYSSGSVGIGTKTPGQELEIASNNPVAIRFNEEGIGNEDIIWDGTNLALMNGKVGIGILNPDNKLEVSGNINASGFCLSNGCMTTWYA